MSITHTLREDPTTGRFDSRNPLGRFVPVPAKIEELAFVSRTTTSITFSWAADANADTYNVYVNSEPTPRITGVTGTQTTLTGLSSDSSFNIRVSGVNTAGEGPLSDPVTMTTEAAIDTSGLLFASNFEGDVQFGSPYGCGSTSCYQDIVGTCPETGGDFANLRVFGGTYRGHLITGESGTNTGNIGDYHDNQVLSTTGPYGIQTRAARFRTLLNTRGNNQNVFGFDNCAPTAPERLYFRYWLKLEADLGTKMGEYGWISFWAWKTSGGDYRLTSQIWTDGSSVPFWNIQGDNEANADRPYERYFRLQNKTVPVPQGEWFKVEVFFDRNGSGRVWQAINGVVVFDRVGSLYGVDNRTIRQGTFLTTRAAVPVTREAWLDEFEVWSDFPADAAPN